MFSMQKLMQCRCVLMFHAHHAACRSAHPTHLRTTAVQTILCSFFSLDKETLNALMRDVFLSAAAVLQVKQYIKVTADHHYHCFLNYVLLYLVGGIAQYPVLDCLSAAVVQVKQYIMVTADHHHLDDDCDVLVDADLSVLVRGSLLNPTHGSLNRSL